MKKLLLSTFLTFTLNSFSQTTKEEYNYMLKGYYVEKQMGLDAKKGYLVLDLGTEVLNGITYNFKALTKETGVFCGLMTSFSGSDKTYVYAVPYGDKDLYNSYYNEILIDFKDVKKELLIDYLYLSNSYLAKYLKELEACK